MPLKEYSLGKNKSGLMNSDCLLARFNKITKLKSKFDSTLEDKVAVTDPERSPSAHLPSPPSFNFRECFFILIHSTKFFKPMEHLIKYRKVSVISPFSYSLDHNHFHNILRLIDVLPTFLFTASETMRDYYL